MDGSLTDRTSSGDLPLPQPQLKAEAEDFLDLTHGHSPWLARCRSSKLLSENSLPTCDVQRHLALWKTFRGIVITVPGITMK